MIGIKLFYRILNIIFYVVVGVLMVASVGSAILQKPLLLSAIKSGSMTPLLVRGDMVVVLPLKDGSHCKVGDIILYHAPDGEYAKLGWICHRIVDGDAETGFITRGDANEYSDQTFGDVGAVEPSWIGGIAPQVGGRVLKVPLIGYLTIGMEQINQTPFTLPALVAALALLIVLSERRGHRRRKHRTRTSTAGIYLMAGLVVSVVGGASMLTTSQHISFTYSVGGSSGAMTGSAAGVLTPGEQNTVRLASLSNKGFLPIVATITSHDGQLTFSDDSALLRQGSDIDTTVTVTAKKQGDYHSIVDVGLFYPFLPRGLIYALSSKSYWLALITLALLPGLPLIALAAWEKGKRI